MTIKQFAALCGCNPQTLRYYDHVNLLKPVQVDQWSGYRYYEMEQALDYVTIKNLQTAGFSIEEIRKLLDQDRSAIREAFDAKIAEQERKLREIKTIRQSYQTEMTQIQEKISKVKDFITHTMKQFDAKTEFGIDDRQYDELIGLVTGTVDQAISGAADLPDMDIAPAGQDAPAAKPAAPFEDDPAYKTVYEKHGWKYAKEFLDDISILEDGADCKLRFRLNESKGSSSIAFMNTLLSLLMMRNPEKQKTLSCDVDKSKDGKNHFWLLKRK